MKFLQDLKTGYVLMGNYKLTPDAEEDLFRIYQWGVHKYGEATADKYYSAFFDHFETLAEQPYLYQAVEHVRKDYRQSVCGDNTIYYRVVADTADTADTIVIMSILGRQNRDEWL